MEKHRQVEEPNQYILACSFRYCHSPRTRVMDPKNAITTKTRISVTRERVSISTDYWKSIVFWRTLISVSFTSFSVLLTNHSTIWSFEPAQREPIHPMHSVVIISKYLKQFFKDCYRYFDQIRSIVELRCICC